MATPLYIGIFYPAADIKALAPKGRSLLAIGPAFESYDDAFAALDEELADVRQRDLPVDPFVIEVDRKTYRVTDVTRIDD
jgi:hypothetical protein